jgi:PilX N-terminal
MTNHPIHSDRGVALIITLLVMMLLSALALSLTMVTSTEERVADAFVTGSETFYAADAAFELAVQELALVPDWNRVLDGSAISTFMGGEVPPRGWPDGRARTSAEATALITCYKPACTSADMDERTADRPWGANNPRWQLFAHGPVKDLSASGAVDSDAYVAVWVGDDPSENDGNPFVDGDETAGPNPGRGVLTLLVHAYGTSSRRMVEGTVARAARGVRVLSWREIR